MSDIKWKEIFALVFLNISIVISWIAYNEYQPKLLENFGLTDLANFTLIGKAVILIIIPPFAGYLADKIMAKEKGSFIVYSTGISLTAITFMAVASVIGAGPLSSISVALPVLVVIWLIAMNLFNSPAVSLIERFAPAKRLPLVAAILFSINELFYALEPVVVELVLFFGDLLTFIVGFILIAASGYIFKKVASDEITERINEARFATKKINSKTIVNVLGIGFVIGIANGIIVEYIPGAFEGFELPFDSSILALILLAVSALLAIPLSLRIKNENLVKNLKISLLLVTVFGAGVIFLPDHNIKLAAAVALAISFSLLSVTALPYIIKRVNARWLALSVGIFFGASEIVGGYFEVFG